MKGSLKRYVIKRHGGMWGKDPGLDGINCLCARVADFDYEQLELKYLKTVRSVSVEQFNKNCLREGDILIEKSGGGEKSPVGRAIYCGSKSEAIFSNFIERVRFNNKKIDPRFALYLLCSAYEKGINQSCIKQTTGIQNLDVDEYLSSIYVPNITVEEQRRIVEKLDNVWMTVSKLIAKKKQQLNLLQEYRQSLITRAVTKGLNLHVPLKKTCYDWCEYIPAHWGVTKIGNVFDIVLGKMLCSSPLNESYSEENYLCAGSISWGGVKTDYVKRMWFSPEEKERFLLKDRDIVIVEGGAGFGMATIYRGECSPCYFQNSIVRLRERGMVRSEFCRYWLIVTYGTYLKRICNEATFSHYTKEKVSQTPIIIPPIDEQDRIVEELRVREDLISETLVKINKQIQKIREYRSSLISRLMPES